jgi:hypothetical protein
MILLLPLMLVFGQILVFLSTQLNRPIWNEQSPPPVSKTHLAGNIPSKTNSFLTGKQCTRFGSFQHRLFPWK